MGLDGQIRDAPQMRAPGGPRPASPRPDDIDLGRVLATLWRSRATVALAALLGLGLGFLHLERAVPLYTARAEVLWDYSETNVVDIDPVSSRRSLAGQDFLLLQSQIEIVRSTRLLGKVVDELGLVGDPWFNRYALPPAARPLDLATPDGWLAGLARLGLDLGLASDRPDPPAQKQRELAILRLARAIEVRWVDRSYVLTIETRAPDPVRAADLANALAGQYILDQLENKFEATRQATEWLSERVGDLRLALEAAEQAVEDYSAASALVSEAALAANARQIKEMRDRRRDLEARAGELRGLGGALAERTAAGDRAGIADRLRRPELATLAAEIAGETDAGRRAALAERFDRSVAQAAAERAQAATRAEAQAAALARSIADLEGQLETQSKALVALRQLEREAEASRLIYESFLARLKETSVQEGIQQPDARMLSDAWVPERPSSPNPPAVLGLGLTAGLVAAVGLVFLRERMNATYRTSADLEARTGEAVLATIPLAPIPRRGGLLGYLADRPNSAFAEAVRNLRTSVLLANVDRPPQVIMVSSGLPGEGKTTTAIALAHISCSLGKSVVVLECDLRRHNFRRHFGIEHEAGLLSVLAGNRRYDEVVHVEPATGMHVLPGEKSPVNAADVFASQRFADFVRELRAHYDFVVIDTPPVLAVPDARVIAQHADALVHVVRWNRTHRDTVAQGLRSFAQVNARVTGVVLSQVDLRDMERYGYRAYGHYREAERYYEA